MGSESSALIGALIRKGILTGQEAEELQAELHNGTQGPPPVIAEGKSTHRISLGMRMQLQHAYLDTDIEGPTADPAPTNHAFLRRMFFSLKAGVGTNWSALMTYNFAANGYHEAVIQWRPHADLTLDLGLRKVNVAYEELSTSGNLRAIERSGVTRYFVESNNGRRLGAASYRIGAFLDGRKQVTANHRLVYGVAITNPERNEAFNLASGAGDGSTNRAAVWGNAALTGFLADNGRWLVGAGIGFLPDQGGREVEELGRGHGITLYSLHADVTSGRLACLAEFLSAEIERGASATRDATPRGWFLQPAYMIGDRFELVVRYQSLDTDGRSVTLADVVRSAPGSLPMNRFNEWYLGANWYFRGNDLKLQFGALHGETSGSPAGTPVAATTTGVRSQMQVQF